MNTRLGDKWEAFSAGTKPSGYVHPKAIQVLAEIGIMHEGESKKPNQFKDIKFDLIVTVCDSAAENCPIWFGKGRIVHHSFSDPAKAIGSEDEILSVFRNVRDEILEKVPLVLREATKNS